MLSKSVMQYVMYKYSYKYKVYLKIVEYSHTILQNMSKKIKNNVDEFK